MIFLPRYMNVSPEYFIALSAIFLSRCSITTQIFMRYFPFLLPSNIVTTLMLDMPRAISRWGGIKVLLANRLICSNSSLRLTLIGRNNVNNYMNHNVTCSF